MHARQRNTPGNPRRRPTRAGLIAAAWALILAWPGGAFGADAVATGGAAGASPEAASAGVLGSLRWAGFLQDWAVAGERTGAQSHAYVDAGDYLKHLRLGCTDAPMPGMEVNVLAEFAGESVSGTAASGNTYGVTLLNAFVALDLARLPGIGLPLKLTVGQFKPRFGLNRMYNPDQLTLADYSIIYNGPSGVLGTNPSPGAFWDDGMQLAWCPARFMEADAAWVNGEGPNLEPPSAAVLGLPDQEFLANATFKPCRTLSLGASYLYGELFGNPGVPGFPGKPKSVTDEYLRFAAPGPSFALEAEFINRSGSGDAPLPPGITDGADRGGLAVILSQYLAPRLQAAVEYDHVAVYGLMGRDATAYMGGLNWFPAPSLRVSLMERGTNAGASQSPAASWSILQTQVEL